MDKEKNFTVLDTLLCKGIAISMVLIHHLFYWDYDYGIATYQIALMAKVSVAIFVFLSGFGLYRSYKNKGKTGIGKYLLVRLKRIYIPYWFIWLIFVPYGVIYTSISLSSVYGPYISINLIINILGIHKFVGFYGYNPTWWFVSLILGLYILSPIVIYLVDRLKLLSVIISMLFTMIPMTFHSWWFTIYIFPFVLGVYVSRDKTIEKYANLMSSHMFIKLLILLSVLAILFWQRQDGIFKGRLPAAASSIDAIISFIIIMICFEYLGKIKHLKSALIFIGRHAYNIFLMHTFICYMYFKDFIYSFSYVPLIFCVLLVICLIISIIMNWLMEISGINKAIRSGS